MPDDQNNAQPIDDSLEVEESESEETPIPPQPIQGGPAGAEQQPVLESQKSVDSQMNKELPPFIQKTLTHAKEGQQQAQQKVSQSLVDEAVAIEEQVLGELASLAGLGASEQTASTEPQQAAEQPSAIHGQTLMAEETPEPIAPVTAPAQPIQQPIAESPQNIVRMADNLRTEVREAAQTPVPRSNKAESQRFLETEGDVGRDATVSLLKAVIEKLEENAGGMDKLAVENSEEALFRMIQKDALKLILERVREGQWDPTKSMESLAMKMGIFSIIGLFRELKSKTPNEATRQRIQQAIDYMLNENDRLDLEDAQSQKASDAVQDDNYADPTATATSDDTASGTVTVSDPATQSGTISTAQPAQAQPAATPQVSPVTPTTPATPTQTSEPMAPLPPGIG